MDMIKWLLVKISFFSFFNFVIYISVSTNTQPTTTECIELKNDKKNPGHIMISYNHSTKALCTKIAKSLKVIQKKHN